MSDRHAFATIRAARSLRERHPDATPGTALVAMVLATYANGRTGTSIRPGTDNVMKATGLDRRTVQRAIAWLVDRDELRRDKPGHRGSAACFTWVGGMGGTSDTLCGERVAPASERVAPAPPHQPNQPTPTALRASGDAAAGTPERCSMCNVRASLAEGLCRKCWGEWYTDGRPFGAAA